MVNGPRKVRDLILNAEYKRLWILQELCTTGMMIKDLVL